MKKLKFLATLKQMGLTFLQYEDEYPIRFNEQYALKTLVNVANGYSSTTKKEDDPPHIPISEDEAAEALASESIYGNRTGGEFYYIAQLEAEKAYEFHLLREAFDNQKVANAEKLEKIVALLVEFINQLNKIK